MDLSALNMFFSSPAYSYMRAALPLKEIFICFPAMSLLLSVVTFQFVLKSSRLILAVVRKPNGVCIEIGDIILLWQNQ